MRIGDYKGYTLYRLDRPINDTDDLHAFVSMSGWNGESLDFTVYFDSESAPSAKSEQTAVTRSHAAFKK